MYEFPNGVDLLWSDQVEEWVQLGPGFLESNFEFTNDKERMRFQGGREVWVKEKPWPFIQLSAKTRFIIREGKAVSWNKGDIIAQYSQNPPGYVLVPDSFVEMGYYELISE